VRDHDPVSPDAGDVYRELAPAVLGYLRAQGAPDPEDTLGEVFYQVARDLGRFRGDHDALRRWVFTIAHHRMVDEHRRRAARPRIVGHEAPERAAADPVSAHLGEDLAAALRELTPEQREVVVLRFVADLSLADVARITRRRTGAVKAMQHRALARLAELVEEVQL
jgi:RNA polymerase sigma factor (sigma-70 family)